MAPAYNNDIVRPSNKTLEEYAERLKMNLTWHEEKQLQQGFSPAKGRHLGNGLQNT